MGHMICFKGELQKIFPKLSLLPLLIWSYENFPMCLTCLHAATKWHHTTYWAKIYTVNTGKVKPISCFPPGGGKVKQWCLEPFSDIHPTYLDYCTCSRCLWGLLRHFFSGLSFLSPFSLSLGNIVIQTEILSQRAVYPKQPTNQSFPQATGQTKRRNTD